MIGNDFVASSTDPELHDFIVVGRPADHPDNKSGIAMPAKGGNSALTDEDIDDIVAYLREIN